MNSKGITFLKTPGIIPEVPRKSVVVMFGLVMGHDYISKYVHKIGIFPTPNDIGPFVKLRRVKIS